MTTDYGRDTSCTDDLRPGRIATGATLVAEACYRRLTTPRGRLIDDPHYGLDVRALLQRGMTPAVIASIPGQVRAELLKDPRVRSMSVRVSRPSDTELVIDLDGATAAGPFRLVLSVGALTVELLRP